MNVWRGVVPASEQRSKRFKAQASSPATATVTCEYDLLRDNEIRCETQMKGHTDKRNLEHMYSMAIVHGRYEGNNHAQGNESQSFQAANIGTNRKR